MTVALYLPCHVYQMTIHRENCFVDLVVAAPDEAVAREKFTAKLEPGWRLGKVHRIMPHVSIAEQQAFSTVIGTQHGTEEGTD
jgi:hypothetical protein